MEKKIVPCRSCGAQIFWVKTSNGKNAPIDAEPVPDGNIIVDEHGHGAVIPKAMPIEPDIKRYKNHFATCPDAATKWRKK
jgi:hypothetical protein